MNARRMLRERGSQALLACAALTALAVGGALAAFPVEFRQSYGVATELDAAALSEVRAPGGALVALGLFMAVGCAVKGWRTAGLRVAAATFLGYGLARVVSVMLDGTPSSDLLGAAAIELLMGTATVLVLARESRNRAAIP
jgi:hypothetical protein